MIPENITDLTTDELEAKAAELREAFDKAYEAEAPLEELAPIADAIKAVEAETTARKEAEAEEAEKRAALAESLRPATTDDDDESTDDVAETDDDTAAEAADETDEADAEKVEEPELVASSAKRATPRAVAQRAPRATPAPEPERQDIVITAAADVPGMSNGQTIDRLGIARALHARARGMGDSQGRQTVFNVASVNKPIPDDAWVRDGEADPAGVIDRVVASQLKQGHGGAAALVASGGFCAPSETMYDLFSVDSRDGLVDLPTVGVSRGGMQIPAYIGLDDVLAGVWSWDETKDNNTPSDSKPCVALPCPNFTDVRLEAEGLCVTAGNLTDRAFPELTARTVDLAITAHLHQLSTAIISKIVAGATAVTVTTTPSDAAGDILNAVDLQVADYRSQYVLGEGTVLDAILPHWFYQAIRSTLAMRAGISELAVTDAQIRDFFTVRNVRPQFVYGYEPLFSSAAATEWPATSSFLLYPTGGYVQGDGGTIDLGVVRDSTLNASNDFTAAWAESFYAVFQRGPAAREVTVTTAVDGQTGGPEFLGA